MATEIVVSYYDSRQPDIDGVIPSGYKFIEDFSGKVKSVIVTHCLQRESGSRIYKINGSELPAGSSAGAVPTSLLNANHQIRLLGPGGVYEQDIVHKSGRAARLIILHHAS